MRDFMMVALPLVVVGMCVKTVRRITVSFCQKEDWRAAVWGLC